ncbi:IclR family transcriptional regulator [Paenibacillus cisolokensis]|uniref:IclR family transcriptional regulator n=1 Tax=Paenibacillus cisolokensis TaxID=1658519 RepID=UPI003D2C8758
MQNKNKTLVKSMDLLQLFITHPALSLNDMVKLSGMPKTSVHRMLMSLEEMGFLARHEDGQYSLGLSFLQFGQLVADRLDIRQVALPIMQELRDDVGEAVNLIMKDGREAIYVEKVDTNHPVRLYTKIGRRSPLYAGDSRIILAFLPDQEREQYLRETELMPRGLGTITDKDKLSRILQKSREDGYTISRSELENDTAALAAPIFDHRGRVYAGLSVAGPDDRFQDERLPELSVKVVRAAEEISRKLGWEPSSRIPL